LRKLSQIFLPFEDTYMRRLEEISETLINIINDRLDNLKTKLKFCLYQDENITTDDIASIEQYIDLEKKI
jgi:hypothetical protein